MLGRLAGYVAFGLPRLAFGNPFITLDANERVCTLCKGKRAVGIPDIFPCPSCNATGKLKIEASNDPVQERVEQESIELSSSDPKLSSSPQNPPSQPQIPFVDWDAIGGFCLFLVIIGVGFLAFKETGDPKVGVLTTAGLFIALFVAVFVVPPVARALWSIVRTIAYLPLALLRGIWWALVFSIRHVVLVCTLVFIGIWIAVGVHWLTTPAGEATLRSFIALLPS